MTRSRQIATRLALVLGAMLFTANYAVAQKVTTNYDTKVDFNNYKTYKWVNIQGASYPNQLQDMQIRQAIDSTLKLKGMVKDTVNPGVYVAYQISVSQSTQYTSFGSGPGMGWGWGGGVSTTTPQTINTGTLVVDLYDPAMKQLVWQSTATKQLNPGSNAQKNQQNLQKAVNKMFDKYPPGAKKN